MKVVISLLLCGLCILGLDAQCPEPSALQDAEGNKLCARLFEHSNLYYEQSCGGEFLNVYPDDDYPTIPLGWNNRVSSLVVSRLCSLTVWSRASKSGKKRKFSPGIQYRLHEVSLGLFGNWNDSISAYYCVC